MSDNLTPLSGGISGIDALKAVKKYRPIPDTDKIYFGKMSWFGQFGIGKWGEGLSKYKWKDSEDNGQNASGLPQMTPGIAYMSNKTLKHWFKLTFPNGKTLIVRQIDIGPSVWTGKLIDVNAPCAEMAGYSPKTFPTGSVIRFQYMGSKQPDGATLEYRRE